MSDTLWNRLPVLGDAFVEPWLQEADATQLPPRLTRDASPTDVVAASPISARAPASLEPKMLFCSSVRPTFSPTIAQGATCQPIATAVLEAERKCAGSLSAAPTNSAIEKTPSA